MLAVASTDVERALRAIQAHNGAGLSDEQREAAERVVDFDAAETTCPACGTAFRTESTRCPECGLNFG